MDDIYELVCLRTTLADISFTFQGYNGYSGLNTRHKLLMRYYVVFGNAEGVKQSR